MILFSREVKKMTETEQKEQQEIEDSRGWRVLNELKDWLKKEMVKGGAFSQQSSTCFIMYSKITEIERTVK